jgi:L-lactate dehydrogenase complex protein LldG
MTPRDAVFGRIRSSLGRKAGQPIAAPPSPLFVHTTDTPDERLQRFLTALHALNVKTLVATSREEVREYVTGITGGKKVVCADAAILRECGLEGNTSDPAIADAGITGASYALAATGTLVMLASRENPREYSLLPPVHIAVVEESALLASIDELFTTVRMPADISSSMVLITGPSRTADIEQILVRGVHGPGELHVLLLRN